MIVFGWQDVQLFPFVTFYVAFALVTLQFLLVFVTDRGVVMTQRHRASPSERTPLLIDNVTDQRNASENIGQPLANPNLACNFLSNVYMAWFLP